MNDLPFPPYHLQPYHLDKRPNKNPEGDRICKLILWPERNDRSKEARRKS